MTMTFEELQNVVRFQQEQIERLGRMLDAKEVEGHLSDEDGQHKRRREPELDEREFRSCPSYGGEAANWDGWKHIFVVCNYKVPEVQMASESAAYQANPDNLDLQQYDVEKFREVVYRHLVQKTTGEANLIVRNTYDILRASGKMGCGFTAFAALAHRYSPCLLYTSPSPRDS